MSWKSIVKRVAPVLGTALGGPFGGMAVKAITSAVLPEDKQGLTGEALEKELETAISGNPEALLKLREADQAFDVEMKKLDVDILEIAAKDRDSARQLAKDTTLLPQMVLSAVYVIAFAVILVAVITGKVELAGFQQNMANMLIGILSAGLVQIMNFFFGSSAGSKQKTEKLANGK
jgi:hypothetical protein